MIKNAPATAGDTGLIPGFGRSTGAENGSSLQYSCLGNPMGREAWWATAQRVAKSQTQLRKQQQQHIRDFKNEGGLIKGMFKEVLSLQRMVQGQNTKKIGENCK